jgi:hypothetical protein
MKVGKSDAQNVLRLAYMKRVQNRVFGNVDHEIQRKACELISLPVSKLIEYFEGHDGFVSHYGMDIDHILPKHAFSESEREMCFHWVNLQPLEHRVNCGKGCKYDAENLRRYKQVFPKVREYCQAMTRRHGYRLEWMWGVRAKFSIGN